MFYTREKIIFDDLRKNEKKKQNKFLFRKAIIFRENMNMKN